LVQPKAAFKEIILRLKCLLTALIILAALPLLAAAQDTPEDLPRHEVLFVLDYGAPVFEPDQWRMALAEETATYTSATWRYRLDEEFLFFFLYLHFEGGANEEAVNTYFSGDSLEALLANYEPWRQTNTCEIGDITLYEFVSKTGAERRVLRYWVQTITPTRVLGVNAAVPEASLDLLDEYARRLFPDAVSCEDAG
jgi:hypothetical protein